MSDYRVIPYREDLLPEIVALWLESGRKDVERRREIFRWWTESNPFRLDRPRYWCLHDGERVVGTHGHMPVIYDVDGRDVPGAMSQDDFLSPMCRGKGLHKVLLDGALDQCPEIIGAMWFNEQSHRSYLKQGWTDVPGFRRYVHFLDARALAAQVGNPWLARALRGLGPVGLAAQAAWVRRRRRRDLRVEDLGRFDERCEALHRRIAPRLGIIVRRTADYLNWRFVSKPGARYVRRVLLAADGRLLGWAVHGINADEDPPAARVLELLADPSEHGALETLLLDAIDAARAGGATHVVVGASQPDLVARLRRVGFLASPRPEYFMVRHHEGVAGADDVRRWYLTLGDADGDVWS